MYFFGTILANFSILVGEEEVGEVVSEVGKVVGQIGEVMEEVSELVEHAGEVVEQNGDVLEQVVEQFAEVCGTSFEFEEQVCAQISQV